MDAAPVSDRSGYTLIELLIVSVLGFILLMAVGQLDVTRIYLTGEVRRAAQASLQVAWAVGHMIRQMERADRINLLSSGEAPAPPQARVQFRVPEMDTNAGPCVCAGAATIPAPCCFQIAGNYRWSQYSRIVVGGQSQIVFYDDIVGTGCTVDERFFDFENGRNGLVVRFRDESPNALGAPQPFGANPADNNVIEVVAGSAPPTVYRLRGETTFRAGAYTNLRDPVLGPFCPSITGPCDTGPGLAPVGVANPPAACP